MKNPSEAIADLLGIVPPGIGREGLSAARPQASDRQIAALASIAAANRAKKLVDAKERLARLSPATG